MNINEGVCAEGMSGNELSDQHGLTHPISLHPGPWGGFLDTPSAALGPARPAEGRACPVGPGGGSLRPAWPGQPRGGQPSASTPPAQGLRGDPVSAMREEGVPAACRAELAF